MSGFIMLNGSIYNPPQELIENARRAFPALNIEREIEAAAIWCECNPKYRKVNGPKFFNNWLTKAQEKSGFANSFVKPVSTPKQGEAATHIPQWKWAGFKSFDDWMTVIQAGPSDSRYAQAQMGPDWQEKLKRYQSA